MKVELSNGQVIDRTQVDEIKKAPGENDAWFVFMKGTSEGRVRFVATGKDVAALGGSIKGAPTAAAAGEANGGDGATTPTKKRKARK